MQKEQANKDLLQESVLSVLCAKKTGKDVYLIDSEKCIEATHSAIFGKDDSQVTVEEINECTICFDKLNSSLNVLLCGHVFHSKCEETWREHSSTCAVCREPVTLYSVVEDCCADYVGGLSTAKLKGIMTKAQSYSETCKICKEKTNSSLGFVNCDHIVLVVF